MFKSSPPVLTDRDYLIEPGPDFSEPPQGRSGLAQCFFLMVAGLQLLDWHSTHLAIGQGREEMNPFILWLAAAAGLPLAVGVAKILALLMTALYFKISRPYWEKKRLLLPLGCVVVAYTVVVINNYSN